MQKTFVKLLSPENPVLYFYYYRVKKYFNSLRFKGLKEPENGWPILFGVSIPKSGTHLLSQILTGFSKVAPFATHEQYIGLGPTLDPQSRRWKMEKQLAKLRPLDVALAHMTASQENLKSIYAPKFLPFFIMRDPRDIVVSLAHYTVNRKTHRLHEYFSDTLQSFDERLLASIHGVRTEGNAARSIAKQIETHIGWLEHNDMLYIRFEDLIENRRVSLGVIANRFLQRVKTLPQSREEIVDALESSINPQKSSTFRSGKTGEWKKYFKDEHKRLFKDAAGDLLVKLGYEKNNDW
jgi:hypothetical protein